MPFKAMLEELTVRTGGEGAILLDFQGERVDAFSSNPEMEGHQLDVMGAHKGIILTLVKELVQNHQGTEDKVTSIDISTDKKKIFLWTLSDDYYLLLTTPKNRFVGKSLMECRKIAKDLKKEMGL